MLIININLTFKNFLRITNFNYYGNGSSKYYFCEVIWYFLYTNVIQCKIVTEAE